MVESRRDQRDSHQNRVFAVHGYDDSGQGNVYLFSAASPTKAIEMLEQKNPNWNNYCVYECGDVMKFKRVVELRLL